MEERKNAGYIITDSIHIGNAEFVIGQKESTLAPFVTWKSRDGRNFFWGHYLNSRQAAERDLLERAGEELERQMLECQEQEQTKKDGKERER